jgi:quinolinate synthase
MSKGDLLHEGHILSTEGMMERAKNSPKTDFIVATETGILYRMQKENPAKNFIPIRKDAICQYMKKITIDKVYKSLLNNVYKVRVPKTTADKARSAIEKMLSIG